MTAVFILVLSNFNLLITGLPDAPTDDRSIILPAILLGGGVIGHARRSVLRSRHRPEVYARIGENGEEEIEPRDNVR